MTGATYAKTALHAVIAQLSSRHSAALIAQIGDAGIQASQAAVLANPIVPQEIVFHAVTASTANGSAPILMAMPAWVGALIGGFILFLATSKVLRTERLMRKQTLRLMGSQLVFGSIVALFSGFTVATLGFVIYMLSILKPRHAVLAPKS